MANIRLADVRETSERRKRVDTFASLLIGVRAPLLDNEYRMQMRHTTAPAHPTMRRLTKPGLVHHRAEDRVHSHRGEISDGDVETIYGAGHLVTATFVQWQNQAVDATKHYHI